MTTSDANKSGSTQALLGICLYLSFPGVCGQSLPFAYRHLGGDSAPQHYCKIIHRSTWSRLTALSPFHHLELLPHLLAPSHDQSSPSESTWQQCPRWGIVVGAPDNFLAVPFISEQHLRSRNSIASFAPTSSRSSPTKLRMCRYPRNMVYY